VVTPRKGKKINFSNRSNERIEFQTVAGSARNSLSLSSLCESFFSVISASLWLILFPVWFRQCRVRLCLKSYIARLWKFRGLATAATSAASILKEGVAKDLRSDNGAGYGNKHPKSKP